MHCRDLSKTRKNLVIASPIKLTSTSVPITLYIVNCNNKSNNDKVNFSYESVALFGINLQRMQVINLASNNLTDDFMEVLRSKKSIFFGDLKTLKLSFNQLTDTTLELIVECCSKRSYRNFQELENLIMGRKYIMQTTIRLRIVRPSVLRVCPSCRHST